MLHDKKHDKMTNALVGHIRDHLLISIDYDHTYTADPDFWDAVIEMAKLHGHDFICITNRPWVPNTTQTERVPDIPIIAAADQLKQDAAALAGYKVNIWIDDTPGSIQQTVQLP